MENGNLAAIHARRVTIMPKDIHLVMKMMEITAAYKTDKPVTGQEKEASQQDRNRSSTTVE